MSADRSIRVLIADDHPVYRFGLRAILAADDGTELAAEATTGEEAIALARELGPDVVLMDINMPGLNGIEATRRLRELQPEVATLMLTMFEDDASILAAMRAGARGYLLKGAGADEIGRAIRAVAAGESIFSPTVAARIMAQLSAPGSRERHLASGTSPFPELTPREMEVLALIASGYTNSAIAEQLFLSPKTVRNHVSSIFAKLQISDRGEAIIRARDAGFGRASQPGRD